MTDKIGVAIVGCGAMGKAHARVYGERQDCRIHCVHDADEARAADLAETFGARVRGSVPEAVTDDDVDLVSVCTPVCFHPEVAIAAAWAGKHVLCEKPIALSLDQARQMDQAARGSGVHLAVSYQFRGRAQYRKYRELIGSGQLAGPLFARFVDVREVRPKTAMHSRSLNGGPLIDMAGHFFDLMRFLTGEEPNTVFASGHVFGAGKQRLSQISDLAIDAAEIQVRYTGGHVASIFVHWGLPEKTPSYTNEYLATAEAHVQTEGDEVVLARGEEKQSFPLEANPPEPGVSIDAMIGAIRGGGNVLVSAVDGAKALAVSLAALQSINNGSPVALAEMMDKFTG